MTLFEHPCAFFLFRLQTPGIQTKHRGDIMKKERKIYVSETERLQSAIDQAEGRATQRCLSAGECRERLERYNLCGMPKCRLKGCKVTVHGSNERMPQSYKYPAQCTQVSFIHDGKDWVFSGAKRDNIQVHTSSCHGLEYSMTDAAKDWLVEYFSWY